jgi:hypothetical protein
LNPERDRRRSWTVGKYKCGRCFQEFDELQAFGDHPCPGENPFLSLGVIRLGAYSIDFRKLVEDAIEQDKVRRAIEDLEDEIRGTEH